MKTLKNFLMPSALGLGALLMLATPQTMSAKKDTSKKCPPCFAFSSPVPKDDSCRIIESGYGVDPCSGISLKGKNVLIIGGSRGIGRATAQAFAAEGANVIATSRHPQCYLNPECYQNPDCTGNQCIQTENGIPATPGLSPFPLELASAESIKEFFENAVFPVWDHIDILYLGGIKYAFGSIATSQASDVFEFMNVHILGFQRVVNQAFKLMADVDDSRLIVMSSIAGIFPLPFFGGYCMAKAALVQYVKQWNMERLLYKKMAGGIPFYKTVAISFEASFIHGDGGNTLPITYEGGVCCPWDPESNPISLGFNANQFYTDQHGMPVERAAQAILWMSTTKHPEWRYGVFGEDEKWCVTPDCKPLKAVDFFSKFNAYQSKKPFTEWINARPWITIAKHPFESLWWECVAPTDEVPALPLPPILDGTCCMDPARQAQRHTRFEYVEDLLCNPCKRLPYDNDFTTAPTTCPLA